MLQGGFSFTSDRQLSLETSVYIAAKEFHTRKQLCTNMSTLVFVEAKQSNHKMHNRFDREYSRTVKVAGSWA